MLRLPALAPEDYATLEPAVMRRALSLRVRKHDDTGGFLVTGGNGPHWVHLYDPQIPRCDCVDHEVRQRICKHLCAVLLYVGDAGLWRQLEAMKQAALTKRKQERKGRPGGRPSA